MGAFVQRCPVCEGRGIVPIGFYMHPAGQAFGTSSTGPEQCKRCYGGGTIIVYATLYGPLGPSAP